MQKESKVSFVHPQFFWILIIPFIVFAFLISTNKERLSRVFDEKVLKRLSAVDESMPMIVRNLLMLVAILLMIVAFARPVVETGEKKVEVEGLTLLTALDISGSMRSEDVYPSRLEFAKKKLTALFEALPSDEVGVVAFAHSSFILAPFSSDKETLKMMVEGVDDSYINMSSTDFAALAEQISSLLEEKKPKVVIVVSDGGDEKALEGFAEILKENEVDLYVILVGTKKGAPVIDENGKPFMKKDGTIAITQRHDALGKVAQNLGGAYVVASSGKEDIMQLVNVIRGKYKNQEQGEVTIKHREEYFYYPLGGAIFLLLIAFSSMPRRRVKS
jgi:Ca-activated chloride channel family protein